MSLDDNGSYREQFVIHDDGNEDGMIAEKEISTEYIERRYDGHGNELSFEQYFDGELGAGLPLRIICLLACISCARAGRRISLKGERLIAASLLVKG